MSMGPALSPTVEEGCHVAEVVRRELSGPANSTCSVARTYGPGVRSCSVRDRAAVRGEDVVGQCTEQSVDAGVDVVDDPPDRVGVLPGRVVDRPVLVARTGEDRAGLAAAHRDHEVGRLYEVGIEPGRRVVGDRETALGEHLGDDRVDPGAGLGAGGAHVDGSAAVVAGGGGRGGPPAAAGGAGGKGEWS